LKKAVQIYKNRQEMLDLLNQHKTKIPADELLMISKMEHALELLADIEVARIGMNINHSTS